MLISLISFISGNLFIAYLFFSALINPQANKDFILNTGILTLFVEFMTIVSSIMISSFKYHPENVQVNGKPLTSFSPIQRELNLIFIIAVFIGIVGIFGFIFKNFYIPVIFTISLITKTISSYSFRDESRWIVPMVLFFLILSPLLIFSSSIEKIFPMRSIAEAFSASRQGGLLVEVPAIFLLWGTVYYPSLTVIEIIRFLK